MEKHWTEAEVSELLEQVMDPEIPVLSLIDLGVITEILVAPDNKISVSMTPTFSGCPAMGYMKKSVEEKLAEAGIVNFSVKMSFDKPWNSNKITPKGREALKSFGLAPPRTYQVVPDLDILEHVACPFCDSENTTIRSPFGPTLCRSMHYCHDCRQMFEQFKPL